jgi:McrBC 5-methylcytosine restriction system component
MAALFERFVGRLLGEAAKRKGLVLKSQTSDSRAFVDATGKCYRRVRPDFTLNRDNLAIAVLDAKYKEYWRADQSGRPAKKISNEDLYQVCFYAQRLQIKHSLSQPPSACIVSYVPAIDEQDAKPIEDRFRKVFWRDGSSDPASVQLILIPMTDILRQLSRPRQKPPAFEAFCGRGVFSGVIK